ncbi:hypothetical protein GCM10022252_06340 [Streptosporangium oxazolinicum]|uniref:Uncharacterized protein n=1 Tax=Streptosporangium oxazolinicum TaxID=909287 RepID=A0ABP8ACF0_9ACTN
MQILTENRPDHRFGSGGGGRGTHAGTRSGAGHEQGRVSEGSRWGGGGRVGLLPGAVSLMCPA